MGITATTVIRNRSTVSLDRLLTTLKHFEHVIVVDENDYEVELAATNLICRIHSNVELIRYDPGPLFNMPVAFNIALQKCQTSHIMFTGVDMMFSPNFHEILSDTLLCYPNAFVMAYMGYLPKGDLPDDPWEYWPELVSMVDEDPTQPKSTGTQISSTEWFRSIRGFDERFVGLGGPDSDMLGQANKHNLDIIWIPWTEAQILHQWHERSPLKGMSSHLIYEPVEERNPHGWER